MGKRVISILRPIVMALLIAAAVTFTVLCITTAIISDTATVKAESVEHSHDGYTAWTSSNSLPNSGNHYLTTDVSISGRVTVSGTLNLCLNGHGIKQTGRTTVFYVTSGNTLNLYDCDETTEHKYTVASPAENGAGLATVNDNATGDYKTFVGGYITGGRGYIPSDYGMGGAIQLGFSDTRGGTFNMYGGTIIGNTIDVSSTNAYGGGVYVKAGGTFNMYAGAITGNKSASGGGVFIEGNSASLLSSFNMYGGTISGNVATNRGGGVTISDNANFLLEGGEMCDNFVIGNGGGVSFGGTTFTMNGGTISGNVASKSNNGYGGGIHCSSQDGTFTLNGGTIKDNKADAYGGIGVSVSIYSKDYTGLDFTMNGGTIENNSTTSQYGGGGGIYVSGSVNSGSLTYAVRFTMTGGEIKNNSSNYSYGGLFVVGKVKFTLEGGSVTGNTAARDYGGVYVASGVAMSLSGDPVIKGNTDKKGNSNLYLYNDVVISINGELDKDASISLYKDKFGVFTNGLEGNGSIDNFVADDDASYFIKNTDDGEAEFAKKCVLTYNANRSNGGSVPPQETYMPGSEATVSGNVGELVKNGRIFDGWNTAADGSGTTYREGDTFEITGDTTLYALWIHNDTHDGANFEKWTATDSLPTEAGDYYLTVSVTITSTWNVPTGVTKLCLNGFGIKLNGNGSVMTVGEGSTLYIYDCDKYTTYYYTFPTDYYGLATNVGQTSYSSGTVSFYGGYITGGNGNLDGSERKGGALYIADGGQAFVHGGMISGNSANYGGAFFVASGGALTVADGTVIKCNSTVGNTEKNSGGAIYIDSDATVYMTGGEISNNYACGNRGAGVQVEGGDFYLSGGNIAGNRANGSLGAGVSVWGGSMYVSGNPLLLNNWNKNNNYTQNNIYIRDLPARFFVAGELTGKDGNIGITLNDYSGSFTNTSEENIKYNRETAFSSDNTSYIIIQNNNGQLTFIDANTVAVVIADDVKTYYSDFSAALSAWGDGCTLTLLKDVTGQVTVTSGTKTLDLNNHSITYSSGSVIIVSGGLLTICDNSENKTVHYYLPNQNGVATLSATKTDYYFEGGYVTGGVATGARGGGLRVLGTGSVVFGGGTLFANSAGWGGGLWSSENSSVTIEGTAAIIGNYSSGNYTSGGGIFMEGSSAVTMTGGSIRHNSAQWSGGGVRDCVNENTGVRFTMTGGEITGNYANNNQGNGFCFDMATTFNIGGTARIIDNQGTNDIYFYNDRYLTIVAPFEEGALIGVTLQGGTGTFTSGWSTYMKDANPYDYFISDNGAYEVRLSNNEAYVGTHVHTWEFTVDGNVITATCLGLAKPTCGLTAQTLTINATGKSYDGQSVVATVVKSAGWTVANGLPEIPEITYSGNVNAGTYTASITVAEKTANSEFTITPINAAITITGHNTTVDYNGAEQSVSGYDVEFSTALYTAEDFTFSGTDSAKLTNVGTAYMGLAATQFANTNANFNTVTFNVTDGYIKVEPIDATVTITGHSAILDYNGKEQGVSGYDVEFSTDLYTAEDFTFSGTDSAKLKNVGSVYMGLNESQFANISANFATVTFEITDGYITVMPINATVTIIGNNITADFNGSLHSVSGYVATADNALYDVNSDFTFSGKTLIMRVIVGTSYMGLNESQFANISANFATVTFEITDGYITIMPINATVTIIGNNITADFNGSLHSVSGYVATTDNALYDVNSDFTFSGKALMMRVTVGTSYMGLNESQFENTNANFATVTFEIMDGYVAIMPIDATVVIRGHSDIVDYDGKEHNVSGYDIEFSTDLYKGNYFAFTGTASASRINVGTSYMGIDATQFVNKNKNFANVTFEVVDGYMTVEPINALVKITGNNGTVDYNGQTQSISGYVAMTDDALYDATSDFTFIGIAKAESVNVGNSYMGLNESQFENTNANFANVVFEITDGYITVEPIDVTVTVTGRNETVDYNGSEQSVTGYDVEFSTALYTEEDFTFSGSATATRTKSGTTDMGLTESLFENTNGNFVVVFVISADGYITVNKVTESAVEEDNISGANVNGLDDEADLIRESAPDADYVSVVMTVEQKVEEVADNADEIVKQAEDKSLAFFEIKVEKTIDAVTTTIDETSNVMEIAIPYEKVNKRGLTVYFYHNGEVRAFIENTTKQDGTFRIDKENKLIYIYANKFSTYAIGYTPYYRVQTSLSLGSYEGKASVTIKNDADENISFTLESADAKNIVFPDVPKGQYTMTIIWKDGKTNTLTMTLTVGPKAVLSAITEQDAESETSEEQVEEQETQVYSPYIGTTDEYEVLTEDAKIETVAAEDGYVAYKAQAINREVGLVPRKREYMIKREFIFYI